MPVFLKSFSDRGIRSSGGAEPRRSIRPLRAMFRSRLKSFSSPAWRPPPVDRFIFGGGVA
ncbi:MAG: hypothetical protein A9Z00_00630 [Thermobacillus sp. ZCTH02-B1]|nr:MAG: hypothetical protein A9Z00_00630 [Thermobacillus sp. ZCTH02-B1]